MTREEAIKSALKFLVLKQTEQGSWGYSDNDDTNEVSWDEVLEWVDRQTCINCISRQAVLDLAKSGKLVSNGNYKSVCDAINGLPSVEMETCGDCVSRQAVIDTIETDCSWDIFNEWGSRTPTGERIINAIKSVPSVEPERNVDLTDNETPIEEYTDCVRRKDVLWITKETGALETQSRVVKLPSVEPERKPGKWIKVVNPDTNEWVGGFKCSECDRCCAQMSMNYCANCGAPMEVSNDT